MSAIFKRKGIKNMKYECPHCHEKSISVFQKMFLAGNMMSKGTKCPSCGKRCVNGKATSIIMTIFYGSAFIFMCYIFMSKKYSAGIAYGSVLSVWLVAYIITAILNLFTKGLNRTLRTDAYDKENKK